MVHGVVDRTMGPPRYRHGMSTSRVQVRSAARADAPLIVALIAELADYERAPEQALATVELIEQHLFGPRPMAECLIGLVDGLPQGFALFFHNFSTWMGKPGIYLEDLFVRPAARGEGLGKALFTAVATIAVERGCGRMDWMVLDWNTPAIDFYTRLGAVGMTEWTGFRLSGEGLRALGAARASQS